MCAYFLTKTPDHKGITNPHTKFHVPPAPRTIPTSKHNAAKSFDKLQAALAYINKRPYPQQPFNNYDVDVATQYLAKWREAKGVDQFPAMPDDMSENDTRMQYYKYLTNHFKKDLQQQAETEQSRKRPHDCISHVTEPGVGPSDAPDDMEPIASLFDTVPEPNQPNPKVLKRSVTEEDLAAADDMEPIASLFETLPDEPRVTEMSVTDIRSELGTETQQTDKETIPDHPTPVQVGLGETAKVGSERTEVKKTASLEETAPVPAAENKETVPLGETAPMLSEPAEDKETVPLTETAPVPSEPAEDKETLPLNETAPVLSEPAEDKETVPLGGTAPVLSEPAEDKETVPLGGTAPVLSEPTEDKDTVPLTETAPVLSQLMVSEQAEQHMAQASQETVPDHPNTDGVSPDRAQESQDTFPDHPNTDGVSPDLEGETAKVGSEPVEDKETVSLRETAPVLSEPVEDKE